MIKRKNLISVETWLIRHGESMANIGHRTANHIDIPLTETGEKQARAVSKKIIQKPDIIYYSQFKRTYLTAAPTIGKFPDVQSELLDFVHEFTYLEPSVYNGTTSQERKQAVQDYWNRGDPDYRDGPNAETFREFCDRGRQFKEFMIVNKDRFQPIFSHALYMKMIMMSISGYDLVSNTGMKAFKNACSTEPIVNTQVVKITATGGDLRLVS